MSCRVLLVDDHPLMRRGINQLLSFEEEFEVVAEAGNGAEAIALAHDLQPDLILLDLNMKGMSGLDTLTALRSDECDAYVVILTVSDSAADIEALVKAGLMAISSKTLSRINWWRCLNKLCKAKKPLVSRSNATF